MDAANAIARLKGYWDQMVKASPEQPTQEISDQEFQKIINAYADHKRHFHGINHLITLFDKYEELKDTAFKNHSAVDLAKSFAFIFYHDVVYDGGVDFKYNEVRSATHAVQSLQKLGFEGVGENGALFAGRVSRWITASKDHKLDHFNYPKGALMLDLDMHTLAGDYDTDYKPNGILCNKEILETITVEKGQAKSLSKSFKQALHNRIDNFLIPLRDGKIFNIPEIREQFEEKAKANIRREIAEIQEGYYLNPKLYRDLEIS